MSGHNTLHHVFQGPPMKDPGASGTISVDRSPASVPLVSLAAETRTLARPTRMGAIVTLHMQTDGGDITLTVTGGYDEEGDTTITFSDPGQFVMLVSCYDGTNYFWRKVSDHAIAGITATAAELNTLHNQTLTTPAGAGITGGTGTIYRNSVQLSGNIYYTAILIDLTGLASSTTDLDIIGVGASPAHLGQITAAQNGATILCGRMQCLEVPSGGVADIDLYSATEGTGVFDGGIAALTETALITAGGAWTAALTKVFTAVPAANQYLYLTGGAGGTAATYTAGQFLIELFGYN